MDAETVRVDDVIAQVEQRPPGRVGAAQPVDLRSGHVDAKPVQDRHARRLEQDPGTDRGGLGGLLEQRDPMPVARQQQGGGAAGRARAHDRDATHG